MSALLQLASLSRLAVQPPFRNRNQKRTNMKILILGSWNICTLMDCSAAARPERRTALIARELSHYSIDIVDLSETRLAEKGSISEPG